MEVKTRVAKFHHITTCPPLRSYPHEVYEPWNIHLSFSHWVVLLVLWHEKHLYILESCEVITFYIRICTLWTHACFDWTCIIKSLYVKHPHALSVCCTSYSFLKTVGVVLRHGIMWEILSICISPMNSCIRVLKLRNSWSYKVCKSTISSRSVCCKTNSPNKKFSDFWLAPVWDFCPSSFVFLPKFWQQYDQNFVIVVFRDPWLSLHFWSVSSVFVSVLIAALPITSLPHFGNCWELGFPFHQRRFQIDHFFPFKNSVRDHDDLAIDCHSPSSHLQMTLVMAAGFLPANSNCSCSTNSTTRVWNIQLVRRPLRKVGEKFDFS